MPGLALAGETRGRSRAGRQRWGAPFVALGFAVPAQAQLLVAEERQLEQVELDYSSTPGCPGKETFIEQVTARVRRPLAWVVNDESVRVVLSLEQGDGDASGRLEVGRTGAPLSRREFTAASCEEVGSALALVVALALDPNASTEPLPPSSSRSGPPASLERPEAEPASPNPPAPPVVPPPPAAPRRYAAAVGPSDLEAPLRYVAWLGPAVGAHAGYAPETLLTLGLSLGARVSWGSWLSPSLQLTPLWGKTGVTGPAAEQGSFAWALARLEACPTDVRLTSALGLSPCLALEVGQLAAKGTAEGVAPLARERWWVAPGLAAALHLERGSWFARLSGEGTFPAIRDEFVLTNPERSVHRPGAFAYGARLGVGFRFTR